MIVEIQQVHNKANNSYKCYCGGENICDVLSPGQIGKNEYYFNFKNTGKKLRLYFNVYDKSFGKGIKERFTMHILEEDNCIGGITGSMQKGEYGAYDVEYRGIKYTSYVFEGREKEDDYLCVYDAMNILVAEIRRVKHLKDYYDYYTAFTKQEELQELLCLLAVHIDFLIFNHNRTSDGSYGAYGYRKAADYYDADFIKEIAYQEGYDLSRKEPRLLEQRRIGVSLEDVQTNAIDIEVCEEAVDKQKKYGIFYKICFYGLSFIIGFNIVKSIILWIFT